MTEKQLIAITELLKKIRKDYQYSVFLNDEHVANRTVDIIAHGLTEIIFPDAFGYDNSNKQKSIIASRKFVDATKI
tara:strand:- start:2714 stop:2941 length:228 start_codon:yes stop_codon:yes gene_type:complete